MHHRVKKYRVLITRFLSKEMTAAQFEETFLAMFKSEPAGMAEKLFQTLDRLFSDIDMFCNDDTLLDEDDLSEDQLREACRRTLREIDATP